MELLTITFLLLCAAICVALIFIRLSNKREKAAVYYQSRFTPLEVEEYKLRKREVIPATTKGTNLSESSKAELFSKLLALSRSKFRAPASAIICNEESGEVSVIGTSEKIRLESLLKHFYKPFFLLGSQDSFGFQETANLDGPISQFHALGYRYIISQPIKDEESNLILWLGFTSPPDASLIGGFKSFVEELANEISSLKHFYGLSERIEAAESANRLKSEAIAHVSHDIRSPLNNIRSILNLLKEEAESNDLVDVALQNCEAVSDIVESMLDYSLHQAGKLIAKNEVLNIKPLIVEVVESYKVAARMKGLALKYLFFENEPLYVRGDKRQIKRILTNLVSNAVKYTKYGHINVNCERSIDGAVTISVQDTGIGMSDEELTQLFVPFTRFDTKGIEGIGLGLALSQVLASLNGGLLSVTSESDKGSVFSLSLLPAKENLIPIQDKTSVKKIDNLSVKRKVLIIDDDKDCALTLSRSLEAEGFDVLSCITISDAMSLINFEKLDAIITDASMPDGGGLRVLKFVTHIGLNLPVAILTGHEGETTEKLKSNGASAIFIKPTDIKDIAEWINSMTTESSAALVA